MSSESLGFSTAEALLYLCASRCGLDRLSKALVGVTLAAGTIVGLVRLLAG
jgi:hypothetical protein